MVGSVLRVTWQDGTWNHEAEIPTKSKDLNPRVSVEIVGDTLVFKDGSGVALMVSESRLISAQLTQVSE